VSPWVGGVSRQPLSDEAAVLVELGSAAVAAYGRQPGTVRQFQTVPKDKILRPFRGDTHPGLISPPRIGPAGICPHG